MITLTGHIEYLILRHDCVVIPGIGALIAHRTPARIDAELGCIFPPQRAISFNPDIVHNDGLLASSVARKEKISYEASTSVVNEQVNEIQASVRSQGEFALGRIGVLKLGGNGNSTFLFTPFEATNVAPDLTGLAPVPVKNLAELSKTNASKDRAKKKDFYYVPVSRNIMQIVASIIVFLILGFTLSTPIVDENAYRASMGMTITESTSTSQYSPVFDENLRLEFNIAYPDPNEASGIAEERIPDPDNELSSPDAANRMNDSDRYFLIIASLPSRHLAEKYINEYTGPDRLGILEVDGRFRIFVASGATFVEANSYNKSGRYPDAWVCKR